MKPARRIVAFLLNSGIFCSMMMLHDRIVPPINIARKHGESLTG